MNLSKRILGILLLLVILFFVNITVAAIDHRSYPSQSEIASDPVKYDGTQVFVFRTVQEVNQTEQKVIVRFVDRDVIDIGFGGVTREVRDQHEVTVRLDNATVSDSIAEGSYIQIYGELRGESTVIDADAVVVDYGNSSDYMYMYGMSILGLLFAVAYFFRHWQVNWGDGCFEPRGEK